jgi:hypothetical protein
VGDNSKRIGPNRLRQFELQRKSEARDHLKPRQYKIAQGHGINRKMKKEKRNQHEEQKRREKLKALWAGSAGEKAD